MKSNLGQRSRAIVFVVLLAAVSAVAQEHKWAGRALNDFEWSIHEKLAALPSYGVFDTINFEVSGKTVTLSGQVVGERVKHRAERTIGQLSGVASVVNRIEVLPTSRRDDALRMSVYRAIYANDMPEQADTNATFPIHIIVKDGWVTLEGAVDTEAERSAFHLRALQVTSHLSDNVRVESDDKTTLSGSGAT